MTPASMQRGFTLAELLGGLAIAAILVLPLVDMLRAGTKSARSVRAALDLNNDARFALGRIAARAADTIVEPPGAGLTPAALQTRLGFATEGTNLVETGKGVIAANVTAFKLAAPEVVDGLPLLSVEMTLSADGNTITRARALRLKVQP
ncbi:PilW family protein [Pseudoduganella dura]|nr:prepilin-type N-terminal cleavage/methylation domain-containing protein [Pseudoduganella dura]GGX80296.1 hypothetical protein GCM10007386_09060 [Pseudoduganella dura]